MRDKIVLTIKSNLPPPNSAATNLIKSIDAPGAIGEGGEGMTLQHTGSLVHAIKYEVEG